MCHPAACGPQAPSWRLRTHRLHATCNHRSQGHDPLPALRALAKTTLPGGEGGEGDGPRVKALGLVDFPWPVVEAAVSGASAACGRHALAMLAHCEHDAIT